MVRLTRWVSLAGAVALASGVVMAPAMAAPRTEIGPVGQEGLKEVAQCLASNPNLLAMMVVDESGSLQSTDPENKRAAILASVVTSLESLAQQSLLGQPRRVDVAVGTFSADYTPWIPWTTLTPQTAPELAAKIEAEVPARNQGGGTDHPSAMAGGRSEIARGTARFGTGAPPCKLMLMFTDGVIVVSDDPVKNQQAADDMCARKGVIDGIRSDNISLVNVMLFDRSTLKQYDAASQKDLVKGTQLLQAMAEGTGGGIECGTVPIPANYRSGLYLEGSADALASLFAAAIAIGSGGTPVPDITGTPATLVIDPGIASFRVVAIAPKGFSLKAPDGSTLAGKVGSGNGAAGGSTAIVNWTGSTVTINIPVSASGVGNWTFARPGQDDAVGLYLFSDLQLQLKDAQLVAGQESTLSGHVVTTEAKPASVSPYKDKKLVIKALNAKGEGTEVPLALKDDGSFSGTFTPTGGSTSTIFDVTLDLTTKSGQKLAQVSRRFVQPVRLAGAFPTVAPEALVLSPLEGRDGEAKGTITFVGSKEGPTKACAAAPQLTEVDDPNRFKTSVTTDCVTLAAGETKTIDVSIRNQLEPSDGQVTGQIPLTLSSAAVSGRPSADAPISLPLTFVTTRPVNQAARIGIVLVLFILGILLPLLLLWLLNRSAARLSLKGLQMARIPVTVNGEGANATISRSDGQSLLLSPDDFRWMPVDPPRPRQWSGGPETLRSITPINPFGSVRAVVQAPTGQVVVGSDLPTTSDAGSSAGLPLDPTGQYYLLVPSSALGAREPVTVGPVATGGDSIFGGGGTSGQTPPLSGGGASAGGTNPFDPDNPFGSVRMSIGEAPPPSSVSGVLVAYIKPEYGGSGPVVERLVATIGASTCLGRGLMEARQAIGELAQKQASKAKPPKPPKEPKQPKAGTTTAPPPPPSAGGSGPFGQSTGSSSPDDNPFK